MLKIGIGPSASHTVGPMIAASKFINKIRDISLNEYNINKKLPVINNLQVTLHGSLAFTGKGHGTDKAIKLGLLNQKPDQFEYNNAQFLLDNLKKTNTLKIEDLNPINFNQNTQIIYNYDNLDYHPNGLKFTAEISDKISVEEIYYSTGGGFIYTEEELIYKLSTETNTEEDNYISGNPFYFTNCKELLNIANTQSISISEIQLENEIYYRTAEAKQLRENNTKSSIKNEINNIWKVMVNSIKNGINDEGILPGELKVPKRANKLYNELVNKNISKESIDWLGLYAIAVSEQNAMGNKIVSAPTNGAAGIIPAVGYFFLNNINYHDKNPELMQNYLLTASTIGSLLKNNASISGSEAGCQAETGGASAMAAAGLTEILGGTPNQVENAAEIALEHHLGLTCDPIKGYVQIPCIERNSISAIKAFYASQLSLRSDGKHLVSLDDCIETMKQTGIDMSSKYKETSLGGLAKHVKIPLNKPLCE